MKDVLNRVLAMPDKDIKDDDHLDKPDITAAEAVVGFKELAEKYQDQKPAEPKSNELADASVKAINKPKG